MSDNLTLEQIETDLKKMNKDLSKLRGYVSAHRDEMCSLASTNQLNKQFSKYLPAGYAFKRNYNVLGIRAIAGRPKKERPKSHKKAKRKPEPEDDSEEEQEDTKTAPKQTVTPAAQPVCRYISNKNIARNHFKEKAWRLYHNIK